MDTDPLQQLRDVHMPADPSWWPPALGWWVLAIVLLVVIAHIVRGVLARYRARAPMRQASAMLARYDAALAADEVSPLEYVERINELLKRYLVRALGRQEFAELSGDAWLAALDQLSASGEFSQGDGRVLGNDRFRRSPDIVPGSLSRHVRAAIEGAYS